MAKLYSHSTVIVLTYKEGNGYPVDQTEYRVRSLGRGRWLVEDGFFRRVLGTAELQRFIGGMNRRYAGDYWSSGEPQYFVDEVRVYKA